ncbi:MAG: type IV secretion system DNA-binding domain-containing protein [Candidatus Kerfeldbacteria bacterium]|nr:type IV secretion system DNA-binding domain-containing protein [Candidatus Kerfeldbacteria bacterium]
MDSHKETQTEQINTAPKHDITFFAQTNFRNEQRRFGVKRDDRRRHMYVIGKTGMGKSTLLENMIIQDIQNGEGVAVVDPHGDLVEKVVKYIPSHRINDVVYFNPADTEFPIAFNILENVSAEYKHLVSNGLVGVFKKIWADSWGPRLEYILINTILALLEYPGSTLLGVTRMLVDPKYRKKIIRNISDPVVKAFWVSEYNNYTEKFRNEAIAPIQNKVGQFLSSSLIRNIVGQTRSTIDMREIMDSGKILLMNLSKGRIGEENAALLGAMMITKIQLAAMSRVDIEEKDRKDFFLYVDEFQNFSTESFANILSEARKYRLCLTMAHQYIEQLSDEVRAAVFGNVGTMIAFRVGATDAEEFEKEFQPVFTAEDMVTLPAHHIYLRLMIDGVTSEPFSASTLGPIEGETPNREKVITVSRERYGRGREVIEEKIRKWAAHTTGGEDGASEDDEFDDAAPSVPVEAPALPPVPVLREEQPVVHGVSTHINLLESFAPTRPTMDAVPLPPVQKQEPERVFDSLYDALQAIPQFEGAVEKQPQQQPQASQQGPSSSTKKKRKRNRKRKRKSSGDGGQKPLDPGQSVHF